MTMPLLAPMTDNNTFYDLLTGDLRPTQLKQTTYGRLYTKSPRKKIQILLHSPNTGQQAFQRSTVVSSAPGAIKSGQIPLDPSFSSWELQEMTMPSGSTHSNGILTKVLYCASPLRVWIRIHRGWLVLCSKFTMKLLSKELQGQPLMFKVILP